MFLLCFSSSYTLCCQFFCFVHFWFPFRYSLTFLHYQSASYFRMQFMFMHFYRRGYTSIVFMVFKLVNTWQPSHVLQKLIRFLVCSFVFPPIKNTILIQTHVNSKHIWYSLLFSCGDVELILSIFKIYIYYLFLLLNTTFSLNFQWSTF